MLYMKMVMSPYLLFIPYSFMRFSIPWFEINGFWAEIFVINTKILPIDIFDIFDMRCYTFKVIVHLRAVRGSGNPIFLLKTKPNPDPNPTITKHSSTRIRTLHSSTRTERNPQALRSWNQQQHEIVKPEHDTNPNWKKVKFYFNKVM